MQLNDLRQQLSYLPRIGSRLECMLFEWYTTLCTIQGLYLISALILRLTVQIGSCGTVVSVIVKQLILHEPVERMRQVCGKLILTTESITLFDVSHQLAQASSHLSYFASPFFPVSYWLSFIVR